MVMPDLGQHLADSIFNHRNRLSTQKRLDLAIKMAFEVYKLHSGLAANSGYPIVHRDIKLENFLYDEKKDTVLIAYFGFASYAPGSNIPQDSFLAHIFIIPKYRGIKSTFL